MREKGTEGGARLCKMGTTERNGERVREHPHSRTLHLSPFLYKLTHPETQANAIRQRGAAATGREQTTRPKKRKLSEAKKHMGE